jgi:transcriptional regulator with XRE-family HTH domain
MTWPPPPLTADEREHLERLGVELRALRRDRGLTQVELARRSMMHPTSISRHERGQRRVRRTTLQRIAGALVDADLVEELVDGWVGLAGPGLAPESDYAERVTRRRERRHRQQMRRVADEMRGTAAQMERRGLSSPTTARARELADRLDSEAEISGAPRRKRPRHGTPHPADVPQPWQRTDARTPRQELALIERAWAGREPGQFDDEAERLVDAHLRRLRTLVTTGEDHG